MQCRFAMKDCYLYNIQKTGATCTHGKAENLTTLSTLAAPVMTPLLMLWLAGTKVPVDAVGMFKSILIVTIVPIAAGFSLNAAFGRRDGWHETMKVMPGVAVLGLACIVGGVVAAYGAGIMKSGSLALIFAGVFLHNSLGYVLGYATGMAAGFSTAKRRTVSIEVGMQNAGLATVLSGKHFPSAETAIASALSCIWHSVSGALLAGLFNVADALFARRGPARSGGG